MNKMLATEQEIQRNKEIKLHRIQIEEEEDVFLYTVVVNFEEEMEKQRQDVISLLQDETRQEENERQSLLCVFKKEKMEEDMEKEELISVF